MFPIFPRFDFDKALEMSKRTYELNREFLSQVPKLRDARDAMLLAWKGPYGDYLYRHCLENDLENHSNIKQIDDWAYGWIRLWRDTVHRTNAISYAQVATTHGQGLNYLIEGAPAYYPPIETRVVDGRFIEAPQWSVYHGESLYNLRAPHMPEFPGPAASPFNFAPVEPPFVYYELQGNSWVSFYSYQEPIQRETARGRGPRPKEVLPLRPWSLPTEQGRSSINAFDLELAEEYLRVSRKILRSLRTNLNTLEEQWRNFERDNDMPSHDSSWLKYLHMVISEMWRTRRFVKKVHRRLSGGEALGTFKVRMPEWKSTGGARRPPAWNDRGNRFADLAGEIGLLDRYGQPLEWDPDFGRFEQELERDAAQSRRGEAIRRLEEENRAAAEAEMERLAPVINGTWGKEDPADDSLPTSEAPEASHAAPVIAAAPAVAGTRTATPTQPQSDPTDNGWFPARDDSESDWFPPPSSTADGSLDEWNPEVLIPPLAGNGPV